MSKAKETFLSEIEKMITSRQYNEEAMNKLLTMIEVTQLLAEQKKNQKEADKLLYISTVGEALAKRLYALKNK